jgi:hypothetical protein
MQDTTVYDLGEVESDSAPTLASVQSDRVATQAAPPRAAEARTAIRAESARTSFAPQAYAPPPASGFDFAGSLSLFAPGAGHLFQRQWSAGLFYLSSLAFLGVLGWAVLGTLDRVTGTLAVLELPRELGVWALGSLYVVAAILHLWNVLSCSASGGYRESSHPVLAGVASAVLPGWGQVLNGDTKRAALFVGGLWVIGAAWLLAAPSTHALLESLELHLPPALSLFSSAAVRWTLPAVIWSLAVYDAAASAAARR